VKSNIRFICVYVFLINSCVEHQDIYIDKFQVDKIELINDRNDSKYPKHLEFNDQISISLIIHEINKLKPINQVGVKSNYGSLYLDIKMKDGEKIHYIITYTRYDGVVVMGQDQSLLRGYSKYYKNDRLEQILFYFMIHD
jgi:hypothetical protein